METSSRLVVALHVDGRLQLLEHVGGDDVENAEWVAQWHRGLADAAERAGKVWVLEVVDPSGEMPSTCLSNDPAQVRQPVVMTADSTKAWLDRIKL